MRRWDSLVDEYMRECEVRGLASGTLYSRRRELERFGAWGKRRRPRLRLEAVNAEDIVAYIRSRSSFHARSTVCGVITDLREMGEFLVREGVWQRSPLRWMRGPKIDNYAWVPRRVSKSHQEKLWQAASDRHSEFGRYQAICVLALLYATGMRRGELGRLELGDWDKESGTLRVEGRKTGVFRTVPVATGAWRCIEAYLPHRHNQLERAGRLEETALLVGRTGTRLGDEGLSRLVRGLARSAGVPHLTLHQFRHTCATDLIEAGVSLPEVQRMLGHACIQSTIRYVQLTDPARSAAMDLHPINGILTASRSGR